MSGSFPSLPDEPGASYGAPGHSPVPGPAWPAGAAAGGSAAWRTTMDAVVALVAAAVTALLGVGAGFVWAAAAPRAVLVVVSPGTAQTVNAETSAFITADVAFCVVTLIAGLLTGAVGYWLAVRGHGPLAMAGVVGGAVAAAFVARWVGEQSGLAEFRHLLATLPTGARFRDSLTLSASGALAAWPLAASLAAGALAALSGSAPARRWGHAVPSPGPHETPDGAP